MVLGGIGIGQYWYWSVLVLVGIGIGRYWYWSVLVLVGIGIGRYWRVLVLVHGTGRPISLQMASDRSVELWGPIGLPVPCTNTKIRQYQY